MESDHDYFARRAREERSAADRASTVAAQLSHLELAERYEDLVAAVERHRQTVGD